MTETKKVFIPIIDRIEEKNKNLKIVVPIIVKTKKQAFVTYNASSELLSGYIGNSHFHEKVFSGGSRGHKEIKDLKKTISYLHNQSNTLQSKLSTTKMLEKNINGKKVFIQRGGTIPPGHYICQYRKNHPTFKECIFLEQQKDALSINSPFSAFPIAHNRSGFFIHGAGPKGSDGCLVFDHHHDERRKLLNKAIHDFNGQVILEVINVSYMLPAEIGGFRV